MLSLARLFCFVLAAFVPAIVVQYCKSVSISFASLCANIRSPCWCLEEQDQLYPTAPSSLCLSPLQEEGLQRLLFRWNKFNCLFHWNWKWIVHFEQWRCLWLLCSCFVVSDWLQSKGASCITPCPQHDSGGPGGTIPTPSLADSWGLAVPQPRLSCKTPRPLWF